MNVNINRNPKSQSQGSAESLFVLNTKITLAIVSIFALGLVIQMGRWQILHKEKYTVLAQSKYNKSELHSSGRGMIYAKDGTVLATDQPSWEVYASLSSLTEEREEFFKEKDKYVSTVSDMLQLDRDAVNKQLTEDFRYVKLSSNVDPMIKKALESEKIFTKKGPGFGLHFVKSESRLYPNGELASHVLGFMGKDSEGADIGLYGIEGFYYGDILGTGGQTYEEKDADGNVILTSQYDPILPRDGKDITLTLDPGIQKKVEDLLKKGVEEHQAKSGTVIIMDPKTGEIISMANYPTYNPNEYWRAHDSGVYKNKAVGDVYEPGSVFKPITVAIALETGTITPETQCNDDKGYITLYEGTSDERKLYTWDKKPDGLITPEEYLQHSNNPCIAQTALDVGHQQYYPMMVEFGIGTFVGTGLQDETNSYLLPFESWTKIDLATTSFGQSISVTPLQMISAFSVIANDGRRMKPYIVSQVSDENEVIKYEPQVLSEPISEETADTVAIMLRSVVEKGDARLSFKTILEEYDVAGKTGTAQIAKKNEPGYYDDKTNTTFIGFGPVENPTFIMLVRLEEPGLGQFSSETVVPVWTEIFESVAEDLEVPKRR